MKFFKTVLRFFRSILLACLVLSPIFVGGTLYINRHYLNREGVLLWWHYLTQGAEPEVVVPEAWGHESIPPINPNIPAIARLLRNADHTALEALAREDPEALWQFSESAPDLAPFLESWVAAQPGSAPAHLARGLYWQNIGWHLRGSGYASQTTPTQFAEMRNVLDRAEADFRQAIALDPSIGAAYADLIQIYVATGRKQMIAQVWSDAVAAGAVNMRLYFTVLGTLTPWWSGLSTGESAEAIRRIVREVESGSLKGTGDPELLSAYPDFIEAEMLRRADRRQAALDRYSGFIDTKAGQPHLDDYAAMLSGMGRNAEALPFFTARLRYAPHDAETAARYGRALVSLRLYVQAREAFDRALAIDSHDPDYLWRRATLFSNLNQFREALADYELAKVYGAERASIWAGAGRMRLRLREELPRAAADYRRAIELDPDNSGYFHNFANVLDRLQDCRAVPAYRVYLQLCQRDGDCGAYAVNWVTVRANTLIDRFICSADGQRLDQQVWLPFGD